MHEKSTHYANFQLLLHTILDMYLAFTYNLMRRAKYFKQILNQRVKSVNGCLLPSTLYKKNSICVLLYRPSATTRITLS